MHSKLGIIFSIKQALTSKGSLNSSLLALKQKFCGAISSNQ